MRNFEAFTKHKKSWNKRKTTTSCRTRFILSTHHPPKKMIIRNKREPNNNAAEITFSLAFTIADVRQWLERLYTSVDKCGIPQLPFSREDITHVFVKDPLREFAPKYAEWISEWAWHVALREEFIEPSSITDGMYFISAKQVMPRKETYKEHCSYLRARARERRERDLSPKE